jgi:hypothetical protein
LCRHAKKLGSKDRAVSNNLLIAGIVCMVAAIVGGGVKMLGAEVPVLNSFPRQIMLFVLGVVFLLVSFGIGAAPAVNNAVAPSPTLPNAPAGSDLPSGSGAGAADSGDTCIVQALTCLPRSSAAVVFKDAVAANAAAAQNVKDGLSTTDAQAAAEKLGASGKASRECGIVQSDDSSPLGKHLAAVRLADPQPGDGQATSACMRMANDFL